MTYQIEVKELPARSVATIRVTVPPKEVGPTFRGLLPEVTAHLREHDVKPAGPPFAVFHQYTPSTCDMEAGVPLPLTRPVPSGGRVQVRELSAGRAAVTWHQGSYRTIGQAHEAVAAWIERNGHRTSGPPWEIYWNDPKQVPPGDLRTEVGYPIEKG